MAEKTDNTDDKNEDTIHDIYEGERILAWSDDESLFITLFNNGVTIEIRADDVMDTAKELIELSNEVIRLGNEQ